MEWYDKITQRAPGNETKIYSQCLMLTLQIVVGMIKSHKIHVKWSSFPLRNEMNIKLIIKLVPATYIHSVLLILIFHIVFTFHPNFSFSFLPKIAWNYCLCWEMKICVTKRETRSQKKICCHHAEEIQFDEDNNKNINIPCSQKKHDLLQFNDLL